MEISHIGQYANYVVDFIIGNPALYAALFIPICINSTIRGSIGVKMEMLSEQDMDLVTWIEIAAQIGSVIALSMANLVALVLLVVANWYSIELKLITIAISAYYLYFYVGFRISPEQFREYKIRLGFKLPPLRNKVTITRIIGIFVEIGIPTYVYIRIGLWDDKSFTIPSNLPSLILIE